MRVTGSSLLDGIGDLIIRALSTEEEDLRVCEEFRNIRPVAEEMYSSLEAKGCRPEFTNGSELTITHEYKHNILSRLENTRKGIYRIDWPLVIVQAANHHDYSLVINEKRLPQTCRLGSAEPSVVDWIGQYTHATRVQTRFNLNLSSH